MRLKGAVASNVEEEAKNVEKKEEEEPTRECKEVERGVEEDGVPPTRASLRLKDLDKFWVPVQLEIKKELGV